MLDDAISITSVNSFAVNERRDLDRYYTPLALAKQLVDFATASVDNVADFAAGTGNLLSAAKLKWPKAKFYANDIDSAALQVLARRLPLTQVECSDFLSPEFHARQADGLKKWSLILLNPPFSQREVAVHVPVGQHSELRCSRSMAFVMSAIQHLAPGGQLLAILPAATLTNKIDDAVRALLRKEYLAEVVRAPAYGLFNEADVSTYFLRITSSLQSATSPVGKGVASQRWKIVRGSISLNRKSRIKSSGDGWVHTTGLSSGTISHRYQFPALTYGKIAPAGAVLVPRVGRFGQDKIAVVEREEFISDCIFAISHSDFSSGTVLKLLHQNFQALTSLYGGTGAPYVARERLQTFLSELAA